MKAIGYIRVSTDKQELDGVSLDMQREKIRAYCDLNDLVLVEIIEDAISAKDIGGRPGFSRALDMVFNGQADHLVFYKLDRAFRSTKDAIETAERFNKTKKGMHSICEKLDTNSAMGEFFFTLIAAIAQWERRTIGERTKSAMQQKLRNREKVSNEAPYGFRYEGDVMVEDESEQACLSVLRELREQEPSDSLRTLARKLEDNGFVNRRGAQFSAESIRRMVA